MEIKKTSAEERSQLFPRVLHLAKRHFDVWAANVVGNHIDNFKVSYMPVISNIDLEGSTNNEIAKCSFLPKQGMSKIIGELEENGFVTTEKTLKDKRSAKIKLTPKGKVFFQKSLGEIQRLTATYKSLVGEKNYAIAIDVLSKITKYHESLHLEENK